MRRSCLILLCALLLEPCCSPVSHLRQVRRSQLSAQLSLADEAPLPDMVVADTPKRDTLLVEDPDGKTLILMKAVRDESGEMVATDVIDAARVTARFRNVAERGGSVDLRFQVLVPSKMQDSRWQLRFFPILEVLGDTLELDPLLITGAAYRKAQLKGYQQYQRFLDSIVRDSLHFVNRGQLELFLKRNLPQIYRYRTDSTAVSDEEFASSFGVTEKAALEHYTNELVIRWNRRKLLRREKVFRRLVKSPILEDGLRLDTVIATASGDFSYEYVQRLKVRPRLRKASVILSGAIFEEDRQIYSIPVSEALTFYISSVSGLYEERIRYKTKIVERQLQANTACYVEFAQGRHEVDSELGNNPSELSRIRRNLSDLIESRTLVMDSIVVCASCSPEGAYASNRKLSIKRSEAISAYLGRYLRFLQDSIRAQRGMMISADESFTAEGPRSIRFLPRQDAENWRMLDALVQEDGGIPESDKEQYQTIRREADPDRREKRLQGLGSYRYLRTRLYPRLRTVRFDFYLHRKDMVKDTVHTTVVDTAYMEGLGAIRDRDYKKAVELLRPYGDYNTAVAYCALDYNASAMSILETLPESDKVLYLKALLYGRKGDEQNAVRAYLRACRMNPAFIHRGNLDPEISQLIKKYNIELQNETY